MKWCINYERVTINLEVINYTAVSLKCKVGTVLIVSIYVPCGVRRDALSKDLDTLAAVAMKYEECIFGGDWNARHPLWNGVGKCWQNSSKNMRNSH